jgi:hypothetical protein
MDFNVKNTKSNDDFSDMTELTAEWTVQAQLKISKPDKNYSNQKLDSSKIPSTKPFIYRWNSEKNPNEIQKHQLPKVIRLIKFS